MSVTLMLVVALAPLAFLLAVMVLGACRASAEDDRMRRAALARVQARRRTLYRDDSLY